MSIVLLATLSRCSAPNKYSCFIALQIFYIFTIIHFISKGIGVRAQILDGTFHWQDKRKMEIRWKSWLDSSLLPSGWSIDKMEKQLMTYLIGLCIKTYKKLFTVWWSSLRMRSDPVRPYEVLTTMPPCLWSVTPAKFIVV